MERTRKMSTEIVIPLCGRVLIRKDDDKKETKGGILLPDDTKIPVITGRIVAIAEDVQKDIDIPISKYDKVLVKPGNAIPVDLDGGNKLFVVEIQDVVAVFKNAESDEDDETND